MNAQANHIQVEVTRHQFRVEEQAAFGANETICRNMGTKHFVKNKKPITLSEKQYWLI